MNAKTIRTLEFDKIRLRLAEHTSFSAGRQLTLDLLPTDDLRLARQWLAETGEARQLLEERSGAHLGGVFDVRPLLPQAERGSILLPPDLLELRSTLLRAHSLRTTLARLEQRFPNLADIAFRIEAVPHLAEQIGRVISERGEVLDSASPKLGRLRQEIKTVQGRLLDRLNRFVSSPNSAKYLQEPIVTQRQGRYVIPVKAEFKGRIRGLVHDQSASGATLFIEPFSVVETNNQWRQLQLDEQAEIRRILAELTEMVAEEAPYVRQTVEALAVLDLIFARAKYANELRATQVELVGFRDTGTRGRGDTGTRGREDAGTRGRGDAGTRGREDAGTQGRGDVGTRSARASETQSLGDSGTQSLGDSGTGAQARGLAQSHPGSVINLKQARHPLLDQERVVPIDVYLDDTFFVLLVTGPNTGGKTVTLKTVGLLVLMTQAGMHVPADEGSVLSCFEGVYADIGDEQSIEQSLSTFSSHLTNIISILEEADSRSLVLLDELGAGTDPEEGSALARALLDHLLHWQVTTLATTHYSDLKVYAHSSPGVRNASVEFDLETLAPTFELSIGLPGRSNALAIATRLGLNPIIVQAAESLVRPEALEADSLLQEIKDTRLALEAERVRAETLRQQLEVRELDLRYQLGQIEVARRQVLNQAREQAQAELGELAQELEAVRRQLASLPKRPGGLAGWGDPASSTHEHMLAEARKVLAERSRAAEIVPEEAEAPRSLGQEQVPLAVGDTVWIPSLKASGQITSLDTSADDAELQIGSFRMRLPLDRLERRDSSQALPVGLSRPATLPVRADSPATSAPQVGMEMDIRGTSVEEMLPRLEKYLDDAYLGMLPWVRIIHGKGTGVLRTAVRKELSKHPLVKNFREGEPGEGGDGVTVAYLVGQ